MLPVEVVCGYQHALRADISLLAATHFDVVDPIDLELLDGHVRANLNGPQIARSTIHINLGVVENIGSSPN